MSVATWPSNQYWQPLALEIGKDERVSGPIMGLGITILYQDVYSEHPAKKIDIKTEIQNNFARFYIPSQMFSLKFIHSSSILPGLRFTTRL